MPTSPLLLLTDSPPTPNGAGISQTLYHLLQGYPAALHLLEEAAKLPPPAEGLQYQSIPAVPNPPVARHRPARWVQAWRYRRYLQRLPARLRHSLPALPPPARTCVLVSTTVAHKLLLARVLQQQGFTVLPYFMDDWLAGNTLAWPGSSLQQVAKNILHQAPAWLMISENLHLTLQQRYALPLRPCLVVHNPASTAVGPVPPWAPAPPPHTLYYTGNVWPMHADALLATAQAIHTLNQHQPHSWQLHLYIPPHHWRLYQAQLAGPGVSYQGWLPYAQVQQRLPQAQYLLCTASFAPAHQAYSHSSVQTKLTDYMAAGRPIIFVGPPTSASGQFVELHDVGFTLGTAHPPDIARRLQAIADLPALAARKAANALQLAQTRFSQPVVQQRLYAFLAQHSPSASPNHAALPPVRTA